MITKLASAPAPRPWRLGSSALLVAVATCSDSIAWADEPAPTHRQAQDLVPLETEPDLASFLSYREPAAVIDIEWSARLLILESAALLGVTTFTGFRDWKWGTASFRFNSEGWFGLDAGSGGQDKLGHLYASYIMSEFLYARLRDHYQRRRVVSVYPALFTTLLTQYIEFFDGYSVDHGYSYEDVIMNSTGIALSFLRNTFPEFGKVVDLRLEYIPSEAGSFHPIIDYEGQKFFAIGKLGGLSAFQNSPLKFLELHVGYYTRGFRQGDDSFIEKRETLIFGVGLSLQELLFRPLERHLGSPFDYLALASNYFQVPYTYYSTIQAVRRAPR